MVDGSWPGPPHMGGEQTRRAKPAGLGGRLGSAPGLAMMPLVREVAVREHAHWRGLAPSLS